MKRRGVIDQLVDIALKKPAKERAEVLSGIAGDRKISAGGRREFLDAVRQAETRKRSRETR